MSEFLAHDEGENLEVPCCYKHLAPNGAFAFCRLNESSTRRMHWTRDLELVFMRLDLFLKLSRLCSRRTVAQKFCDAARVSVNGHKAKSSHAVKVGDEIAINRHQSLTTIRVLDIPSARQTSRKQSGALYELVSEESLAEDEV